MTAAASVETPMFRRVLANAGMLLGGRAANALISLAYLAIAARALGVAAAGALILINAFAQLVGEVVKFNSWQTVLHYGAGPLSRGDKVSFHQVIRFTLFLDVTSSIASVALAVGIALLFGEALGWNSTLNPAAAVYCLSIALMTPSTPIGLLRLFDRFDLITLQQPIHSAVRLAGSALILLGGISLEAFLAAWAAGTVAAFAYLVVVTWREMRRRDLAAGFRWTGPLTAGMPGAWRFAWATNLSTGLEVAFTHAITLVVGAMVGAGPAALWRIGRQVADALAKPARLLIPALYPELARLHVTEGEGAMRRLALQVGVVGGGVGTVLLGVTALFGGPLLSLVMGPDFVDAGDIMTWQVAAAVIGIWALPLEPMLVSLGRPGDALKVRLAVSALLLLSLPFVVGEFGITGAGASLVAAMAALAVGMFIMLQRRARKTACENLSVQVKGGE